MTVHKLSVGDGYLYLTRNIAGGDVDKKRTQDASAYYTAEGNPPGSWIGRGAPLLGLAGEQVTEDQMRALFGHGHHPNVDQIIADHLAKHVRPEMSEKQIAALTAQARREASLGRAFPEYEALDPFNDRVAQRATRVVTETGRRPTDAEMKKIKREEAGRGRGGVAGYDAVFAPVKSAALLWALDPREEVRQAIFEAHQEAKNSALAMLEKEAAFTRTGAGGIAQVDTKGLVAVAFDHYDSRDGDPNLHTHVAISAKVCGTDGKWRSLDGRALYRITVAASEHYNTQFQAGVTARLGVEWVARTPHGKSQLIYEIAGIPEQVIDHFSRRRNRLYAGYQELIDAYRAQHGKDPDAAVCHKLARQATLDTRDGKKPPRSLAGMRAEWTADLTAKFGPDAIRAVMDAVPGLGRHRAEPIDDLDVAELAATVVVNVSEQKSTWCEANLRAEAERLIRAQGHATNPQRANALAEQVLTVAVKKLSISVEAPAMVAEPEALQRANGDSVFRQHGAARFTSTAVLAAEDRLLKAARTATDDALPKITVEAALAAFDRDAEHPLDAGQRELVTAFACSDALIAVGIGAAGTGKTTAMRAYLHTVKAHGRRIIPLATSASSAAVLASDLGVPAENLHKLLHEHLAGNHTEALWQLAENPDTELHRHARPYAIRPGDVILVDEAGMAGTANLDRLRTIAERHGAVVRLLGDYRQLGAVESGGALRLIAHDVGAVELSVVHRFHDPAEAAATLKMRVGDNSALDFYEQNQRIQGGSAHAMLDAVYTGWQHDIAAGKVSIMCAATNHDVTALAARARLELVTRGKVEPAGVELRDGNIAGRGDWIVTRRNKRRFSLNRGRDWVRNGSAWTVVERHNNGSLTVRAQHGNGTVRLPADYVANHVELMYATTVHRAQGDTVDTTHALITDDVSRENLYVAATRGRASTALYTVTHQFLDLDEDLRMDRVRRDPDARAAREVLENIIALDRSELTATEAIRDSQHRAESLATLMPQMIHVAELVAEPRYRQLVSDAFPQHAEQLTEDGAWGTIRSKLRNAETAGWPTEQLLAAAAQRGPLDEARSPAQLLAWRLDHITDSTPAPAPLARPDDAQAIRYADLLQRHIGIRPRTDLLQTKPGALRTDTTHRSDDGYIGVDVDLLDQYAAMVADATGTDARTVAAHHAWPHLAGTIAAWHRAGKHPDPILAIASTNLDTYAARATQHASRHGIPSTQQLVPAALRHHQTVTDVLGKELADHVRSQPGWTALHAAIGRAHRQGHDTWTLLTTVTEARSLDDTDSAAQVLAWRLNRHLHTQPTPGSSGAWAAIAWTLAAHEHTGGTAEELLTTAPACAKLDDLATHLREQAQAAAAHRDERQAPPWTPTTTTDDAGPYAQYLLDSEQQIGARILQLAEQAARDRPAWTAALGHEPSTRQERRPWLRQLGIVAAYRDQQNVTDDDPRHPLGPYIESGKPGHRAYWHAAQAIIAARPSRTTDTETGGPAGQQVAADTYLALSDSQRRIVATTVIGRLGAIWYGDTSHPDEAITQPAYTAHLQRALRDHRHLADPDNTTQPAIPSTASVPGRTAPTPRPTPTQAQRPRLPLPRPQPRPGGPQPRL
ncbi:MobF family relaxase [Pilimelia columellifera]|uniref:TrwC relaxase domain-containing protein n=1 Tax=Pilimelia columellifera subsp. columellifera TaxID=706583 RepID=A0ABP6AT03_9ACTN